MSASERLRKLVEHAVSGDTTPVLRGIGVSQRGKVELFSRLAYIAGLKRALEMKQSWLPELEASLVTLKWIHANEAKIKEALRR